MTLGLHMKFSHELFFFSTYGNELVSLKIDIENSPIENDVIPLNTFVLLVVQLHIKANIKVFDIRSLTNEYMFLLSHVLLPRCENKRLCV